MNTRLYTVTNMNTGDQRLIEASSPAAARNHVAIPLFSVNVTKPVEAAKLVKSGVVYEVAGNVDPETAG